MWFGLDRSIRIWYFKFKVYIQYKNGTFKPLKWSDWINILFLFLSIYANINFYTVDLARGRLNGSSLCWANWYDGVGSNPAEGRTKICQLKI